MNIRIGLPIVVLALSLIPRLAAAGTLRDERETPFSDVRQFTFGGENAGACWSPDGSERVFQRTYGNYACEQVFRMPPSDRTSCVSPRWLPTWRRI